MKKKLTDIVFGGIYEYRDKDDKIIYRGVEIRLNKELNFYLSNFHIKDLETLL